MDFVEWCGSKQTNNPNHFSILVKQEMKAQVVATSSAEQATRNRSKTRNQAAQSKTITIAAQTYMPPVTAVQSKFSPRAHRKKSQQQNASVTGSTRSAFGAPNFFMPTHGKDEQRSLSPQMFHPSKGSAQGTRLGSSDGYQATTLDGARALTRESVDASLQAHPISTAKKSLQAQTRQTNRTRFGAESPISLRKIIERLEDTQKEEIKQVKALKKLNAKSSRPVTNVNGSAGSSRVAAAAGGNISPREQVSPTQTTSVLLGPYNTRSSNLKHSDALTTSIRHTSVPGQRNGLGIKTQPARTTINSAGGPGIGVDSATNENFLPSLQQPRAIAKAFKTAASTAHGRQVSVSEARTISPMNNLGDTAAILGRHRMGQGNGSRSPSPLDSITKEPSGEEKVLHLSNVFPFFNLADQKPGTTRADDSKPVTASTAQEKIVGQIELTTGRKLEVSPTALQMHLSVAQERRLIDQTRRQAQSLSRRDHEVSVLMDQMKKKTRKTSSIAPVKQTSVSSPRRPPFDSHMSAVKQEIKEATSGSMVQGSAYLPSSLKKSIQQKQIVTQIKQMQKQIRKEHQKLATIEQPPVLPPSCQVPPKQTAFQREMALWKQELDENFGDKFRELTEQKAVRDKVDEERKREEIRLRKLRKQERLQKKKERQERERLEKIRQKREAKERARLQREAAEARQKESEPTAQPNPWQFGSEIELDKSVQESSKNDQDVFSMQARNFQPPLTSDGMLEEAEIATFKSEPPMELNSPDAQFDKDGSFSPDFAHRGTLAATANRNITEAPHVAIDQDDDDYSDDGYEQEQDRAQEELIQAATEPQVQTEVLPSPPGTQDLMRSSQNQGMPSELRQQVISSEDGQTTQVDIVQAKDLFESDTNHSQRARTPPIVQARSDNTRGAIEMTPQGALPLTAAVEGQEEEDYEADQLRMSGVVPDNRETLAAQDTAQMYNTMTADAVQDMIQAEQTTIRDSFQRSAVAHETEPNGYLEDYVNREGCQEPHVAQESDLIVTEQPAVEGINDTPFFAPPAQQMMNLKDVSDYLSSQQKSALPQPQLSGGNTIEDGLSNPPALEMSPTHGKQSETIEVEDVISADTNQAAARILDHHRTRSNVLTPTPITNDDGVSQEAADAAVEALRESSALNEEHHGLLCRNNANAQYSSTKGNVVASPRDIERIEANRSQNAKSSLAVMQRLDNPIAMNQHESAPEVVDPIDQLHHDSIESAHVILAHSKMSKHIQTSDPLQKQIANIPDYQSQVNYTNSQGQVPQLHNSAFDTGLDEPPLPQPAVREQRGSFIGSSSIVESQISETVMTQKSSIIEEHTSAPGMVYSGRHDSTKKDDTVANMPQPARKVPDHPGMKLVESSPDNLTDEQVTVVDVKSQVGDGPTFMHVHSLQPRSPMAGEPILSRNDDSHTTIGGAQLPGGQKNIGGSNSRGAPLPDLACVLRQGSDMTMQTEQHVEYNHSKIGKAKKPVTSFGHGKQSIGAHSVQQRKHQRDTISIEQSIQSVSQITEFAPVLARRPTADDKITSKPEAAQQELQQSKKHVFVIKSGQTTVQTSRHQRVGSDMSPIETPKGSLPYGQKFIQEETFSQARACVSGGAANWTRSSVATEDATKAIPGSIKHRKAPIKVPAATAVAQRKGSLNQPRTQQLNKQKTKQTTAQSRPPKATPVPVRPKPLPKAIHQHYQPAAIAHSSGLTPKNQSAMTTPIDYSQAIGLERSALNHPTSPPLPIEYSNYQTELVEYNQTSQSRVCANGMAVATDAAATEPGIYNEDRVVKIAEKISKLNFQLIQFQNDIEDQKKDPILKSTHRSNASKRNLASQKSRETALTVPLGQTMNPTVAQAAKISQLQELRSNGQLQSAPGRSRAKPGSRQRATPEGNHVVASNEFLVMEPRQSVEVMTTGQQARGSGAHDSQPALGLKEDDVDNCTSETHTHVVRP